MPPGEGRYHAEALAVLNSTHADGVVLMVINGEKGHGLSVIQLGDKPVTWLAGVLRSIVNEMEGDLANPNGLMRRNPWPTKIG